MHYGIDPRKVGAAGPLLRMPNGQPFIIRNGRVQPPNVKVARSRLGVTGAPALGGTTVVQTVAVSSNVERNYEVFEHMLYNTKQQPLETSIEQALQQIMNASACYVWLDNSSTHNLASTSAARVCDYETGIVGLCYRSREIHIVSAPAEHENFNDTVDYADMSSVYIPLETSDHQLVGIALVVRYQDWLPFSDDEQASAEFFKEQFAGVAHLLVGGADERTLYSSMAEENAATQPFSQIQDKLTRHFRCRVAEIWQMNGADSAISCFVNGKGFVPMNGKMLGAVGHAMQTGLGVNIVNVMKAPGYSADVDGGKPESVLVVLVESEGQTRAIALRGKAGTNAFSAVEMIRLEAIAPMMTRGGSGAGGGGGRTGGVSMEGEGSGFAPRLRALLEVAEILSGVLDIDKLIPIIMDRACSLLHTERCSLFLVDLAKQELVSRFHGGLDKSIRIPIGRGLAGHTAKTGEVVNIPDVYEDPRFDKTVDVETGYTTKSILVVPIYNNRGEIAGATEMINRVDGSAFDAEDIKMMVAFNVFCGISLDNAKLYQMSLDLTRQLRGFVEMSSALNKTKTLRDVMEEILTNAQMVISATRATVFLAQEEGPMKQFLNIGTETVHKTRFAEDVVKAGVAKLYDQAAIIALQEAAESGAAPEPVGLSKDTLSSSARSSSVFSSTKSISVLPQFEPVCAFPLINNEGKTLGVMELSCAWKVLPEDMKLLDCFATFATMSLERSELQEIAQFGHLEAELKKWISDDERKTYTIPEKLELPTEKREMLFTSNVYAQEWDGIGLFKILWTVFNQFHLLEDFKVNNETFFRFIHTMSETYKQVPYHNWRHACDVTQFLTVEIVLAELNEVIPKFELFGLLTAAVCHDANHDGFTNVFNVKAETPLGILFKNQSVMETHHCSMSIGIISKEECNIFSSLTAEEYKKMWTLMIKLILITDMAKHFDFLKSANALMDEGPIDLEDEDQRLIAMQLLLKCGDISNVARPFGLADKWCDVLCEEFFRQGDLEMASGMEYTSPLNDREHLDKPKSQIGFYTFVCLPLFQTASRAIPALECNCDQIKSNLAVWKKASEEGTPA